MSAAVAQLLKTRRLPGGWSQQDPPGLSGGLSVGQLVWDEFIVSTTGGAALRLPFVQPEPDDAAVVLFTWGKSTEGGGGKRGEKGGAWGGIVGTLTDAAHDAFIGDGRHEVGVLLGARVALRPEHAVGVLGGREKGVWGQRDPHPRQRRCRPAPTSSTSHSPGLCSWPPAPSAPAPSPAPHPWRGRLRDERRSERRPKPGPRFRPGPGPGSRPSSRPHQARRSSSRAQPGRWRRAEAAAPRPPAVTLRPWLQRRHSALPAAATEVEVEERKGGASRGAGSGVTPIATGWRHAHSNRAEPRP